MYNINQTRVVPFQFPMGRGEVVIPKNGDDAPCEVCGDPIRTPYAVLTLGEDNDLCVEVCERHFWSEVGDSLRRLTDKDWVDPDDFIRVCREVDADGGPERGDPEEAARRERIQRYEGGLWRSRED